MNWFEQLRSWFSEAKTLDIPKYGRGIHALPNPQEKELFEKASEAFIRGETVSGYEFFLSSLLHDETSAAFPHLTIERQEEELTFRLFQGSALINGLVRPDYFEAHAEIAVTDALHVAAKRRFLERNFQLTYAKFSNIDGIIRLSIKLDNTTITPQKIFYPLREIALNADFEKEFIAAEFDASLLLEYTHLIPLPQPKTERYHAIMKKWISQTKQSLIGLLSNDNTGMASFSYLALLLQIDYLLIPHRRMAKNINEKINGYFLDDEKMTEDKNAELESYLSELETMDIATFGTQFYDSAYTFSPFEPAMHDEIAAFIEESLNKVRWYKNNHANYVISVIYRYIALYILYNYGLHPSLRSLLHLHIEVYCSDFFEGEGEVPLYDPLSRTFQKHLIAERIARAVEPFQSRYKGLRNFAEALNYTDLDHFSQSFYLQIKNLDYTES